ncbi:DUF423 domain-containing protein [Robertkochia marina]|uniref:DUF423 domain-containing protein n=1 Tax=Robertkochia marina TaxID=1227945 RepID=A0A4S3M4H7_9FLAO|nr:DUF423 domain-containing protein [Robertkochia marina]THD69087.1 DUF423 domain-containing protein [Robertkochia marina]TRZ44911.1 DUF423 domain-containing protein [Robertkochia marina]
MVKTMLITGALFGGLAVILGAFGAHALKNLLEAEALKTFETGVKYQIYHALFLMVVANLSQLSISAKTTIFYLVLIGVILFSGSIYLLASNSLTAFDFRKIGFVTPLGGTLLIVAWGLLVFYLFNWEK